MYITLFTGVYNTTCICTMYMYVYRPKHVQLHIHMDITHVHKMICIYIYDICVYVYTYVYTTYICDMLYVVYFIYSCAQIDRKGPAQNHNQQCVVIGSRSDAS